MINEIDQVKVEKDNGHKDRWAFGRFFYRKESIKKTLSSSRLLMSVAAIFLVSGTVLITRGPSQEIVSSAEPIQLRTDLIGTSPEIQNIPPVSLEDSSSYRTRPANRTKPIVFKGAEHIERPRLITIPPGTIGQAVLLTAATDGSVRAQLQSDLVFNEETLLPKGTTLIGVGSSGEDRLTIKFTKVVFKDGKTQSISAEAVDQADLVVGLKGSKISKYAAMIAAAGALSFAGGVAEGMQDTEVQNGTTTKKTNLKNAALNGASHAAIDTSSEIITKWKERKSVIQVPAATEFSVSFGDLN